MPEPINEYDPEKHKAMMQAVGEGISAFAVLEVGLGLVFAGMLLPTNRKIADAALIAARHIETKMRIVKAVGAHYPWPEGQRAVFNNLMNRLKNRAEVRNKLAHWMIVYTGDGTAALVGGEAIKLLPSSFMSPLSEEIEPLTMAQIHEFTAKCGELVRELFALAGILLEAQASKYKAANVVARGVGE